MFAIWTFFLSLFLIALFLALKFFELKYQKRFFGEFRNKADHFVTDHAPRMHRETIHTGKQISERAVVTGLHFITIFALRIVRFLEKKLVNVINIIKGRNRIKNKRKASDFLMKVSEHKNDRGFVKKV